MHGWTSEGSEVGKRELGRSLGIRGLHRDNVNP